MRDSLWFTTRSALFRPGDQAWEEVARYEQPLRRLLARRYARQLSEGERDDLVQDALIEIKETLTTTFDRSRGRFRALLQTVVARRVVDGLRKARPGALAEGTLQQLEAPTAEVLDALDLEAALLEAVSACRDRFSGGKTKDLAVLHAMTDRLVHGLSSVEIARKDGVSRDRVSRLLAKGRDAIFSQLLGAELGLPLDSDQLADCVAAFKRMLRKPTQIRSQLEELGDAKLAERLETFWLRLRAALPRFEGDLTVAGRELAQGVELIFG